jgi:hypothetical protein
MSSLLVRSVALCYLPVFIFYDNLEGMYVSSAPCLLRVLPIIVTSRRLRMYKQIISLLVLLSSSIRSSVC